MKIQLDTPNPAMEPEALEQVSVNNTLKLQREINKTGANELLNVVTTTATSLTNTKLAVPVGMEGIISTTGGWTRVMFHSTVGYNANIDVVLVLEIDGEEKERCAYLSAGFGEMISLQWEGALSAGRHSVRILEALPSTGLIIFSANSSTTRLQVMEIAL